MVAAFFDRINTMDKMLGASTKLVHDYDEGNDSVYSLELQFIDFFGRDRKHIIVVSLPKALSIDIRSSFTAVSSVDIKPGIVTNISSSDITVLLMTGESTNTTNYETDFVLRIGDAVYILEHYDLMSNNDLIYLTVPSSYAIMEGGFGLQSVNADIIDSSGILVKRLSADPFLKTKYNVS